MDSISWETCAWAMARLGFDLPTEAQWHYAARGRGAEGDAPWGLEVSALRGAEWNLVADPAVPLQVHGLHTNSFGLVGLFGNVGERCRDWAVSRKMRWDFAPGTCERVPEQESDGRQRVYQGGFVQTDPSSALLRHALDLQSFRFSDTPASTRDRVGVRPARALEP